MARKNPDFVVTPLSPELDGHFGKPSAKSVNEDAAALLDQMGGAETAKRLDGIKNTEKRLAKLGTNVLAREIALPETAEAAPVSVADFLAGMHAGFAADLGNELESRPGVRLTKEALAAVLGDAKWLERIADDCKEYVILEQEHGAHVTAALLGTAADEAGPAQAA